LNRVVQQVTLPEWFQNDNDNKENYATDEDSACTMTLTVPNAIKKVVISIYSRLNGVNNCCEMPQSIIS
jgi:hypothetical protein